MKKVFLILATCFGIFIFGLAITYYFSRWSWVLPLENEPIWEEPQRPTLAELPADSPYLKLIEIGKKIEAIEEESDSIDLITDHPHNDTGLYEEIELINSNGYTPETYPHFDHYLEKMALLDDDIAKILKEPFLLPKANMEDPAAHTSIAINICKYFDCKMDKYISTNNTQEIDRLFQQSQRLATLLDQPGTLLDLLVQIAIQGILLEKAEKLLLRKELWTVIEADYVQHPSSKNLHKQFSVCIKQGYFFAISALAQFSQMEEKEISIDKLENEIFTLGMKTVSIQKMKKNIGTAYKHAAHYYNNRDTLPSDYISKSIPGLEAHRSFWSIISCDDPIGLIFINTAFPALEPAWQQLQKTATRSTLLQTALAIRTFQHHEGHWPHSLDVLIPEYLDTLPLDPTDNSPIRYQHSDKQSWSLTSATLDRDDEPLSFHYPAQTADIQ